MGKVSGALKKIKNSIGSFTKKTFKRGGFLKKVKRTAGKLTANSLKGAGYIAKGIGKVANFDEMLHGYAKRGAYGVTDFVIPGLNKAAPTLDNFSSGLGSGIASVGNIFGNWYKDELKAHKNYLGTSATIWDMVGDGLIGVGDWINKKMN